MLNRDQMIEESINDFQAATIDLYFHTLIGDIG